MVLIDNFYPPVYDVTPFVTTTLFSTVCTRCLALAVSRISVASINALCFCHLMGKCLFRAVKKTKALKYCVLSHGTSGYVLLCLVVINIITYSLFEHICRS
jgi:hypothetical protein